MNLPIKIGIILISISLFSSIFFGIDKYTSSNPDDASLIRIGLSNFDTNTCKVCQEDGIYYNSGCKRCVQDSIVIITHVNEKRSPILAWSNDNTIGYGDEICSGHKFFEKITINDNSTYWIEIIKDNLELKSNFYTDENYLQIIDNVKLTMCSNPSDLQYVRVSNEDGKPAGNGGKLFGYIDNMEINNSNNIIFLNSFDTCKNESCDNLWTLENQNKIFVDTVKQNLAFFSEVTGTTDYATLNLEDSLPNSWTLRFKLHIDELESHPRGKGILGMDPSLRQIIFGFPALFSPFVSYLLIRKTNSKFLASLIILSGVMILSNLLFNFESLISNFENMNYFSSILSIAAMTLSTILIILGLTKLKKHAIRRKIR